MSAGRPAGQDRPADSLDLLGEVSDNLRSLAGTWYTLRPSAPRDEDAVSAARQRGTVGKEILEQAALRLAAAEDVARVLRASGGGSLARVVDRNSLAARRLIARLAELSRGVSALNLRYSDEFPDGIDQLRSLWADEIDHQGEVLEQVAGALGEHRGQLRSATFIRGHAPIHPSEHRHRYQAVPVVARLHALYDRIRGFPDAESLPTSDTAMIARYDPEG